MYVFKVASPYNATEFEDESKLGIALVRTLREAHLDAEGWLLEACQTSEAHNLVVGVTGNERVTSSRSL